MTHHDLSHWPLVVSVASGLSTLEDMQAFTDEWNRWLERGEPFASLRVFADADALVHPAGAAQAAKLWLHERGPAIRAQVMGMASVVPIDHYEKMRKMNVEKLFGVPADTFAQPEDALTWLQATVYTPRGLVLDQPSVLRSLAAQMKVPG
ncbi:hypothetical protein [Pollutimonas bauzanensis]|uniref:SpoIIAA-like n=1 Tax=Pollutimonas bauzanensis TaxID=658167 RepID=A0A1M5W3C7_9BURK|nr:hypothetical protein [Pollutimonas bauzanensis]SHH81704.1 hypothetical protein SAMN04488135_10558 [Pollutimonas bauzanensis]